MTLCGFKLLPELKVKDYGDFTVNLSVDFIRIFLRVEDCGFKLQ